ncbi:dienelactone hydrolase family protein [Limnochorda pilosa]|uniref:Dienelactone hydrolase n=1 Tax=Limnochorda pilosa TaxID=1555112 RepID=A0A0K2SI32_LIMPI|nr:dienelactone hydrolase [Limnochorda pilosa]
MIPGGRGAFLAVPPTGKGPGVLVLHAWWGLSDTMKGICTQLAESGFVAFAPDLYHGKVAKTIADAEALGKALDANHLQAKAEIAAATAFLAELEASLRRAGRPVTFYRYAAPDTGSSNLTARRHTTHRQPPWRGIEPWPSCDGPPPCESEPGGLEIFWLRGPLRLHLREVKVGCASGFIGGRGMSKGGARGRSTTSASRPGHPPGPRS